MLLPIWVLLLPDALHSHFLSDKTNLDINDSWK